MENTIQLDVFEGPLDLLLYLVKKEEVDIYEVNLTRIATQFIEYVDFMRKLDLDVAGEFLVMAATLMFIKSRELLPLDQQVQVEDEETDDPRWELIRQLVEYKRFKDAASELQEREAAQEDLFPRRAPRWVAPPVEPVQPRLQVSVFDLINAVNAVLKRFHNREGDSKSVFADRWTVSEKIETLIALMDRRESLQFSELFSDTRHPNEVVVTFLALLELIRLKRLTVAQKAPFAEIEIFAASADSEPAAEDEPDPATEAPAREE